MKKILFLLLFLIFSACSNKMQEITFETKSVFKEAYQGNEKPQNFVITNEDELEKAIKLMGFQERKILTEIDFKTQDLILIYAGMRPTASYKLEINEIKQNKKTLNITFTEIKPGANCYLADVLTYPYVSAKVEKLKGVGNVEFNKNEQIQNCN